MGFWIFMLVCNMLIPILMIAVGRAMWKHPLKKINGIYGYRTRMSMKNKDAWAFAHEFGGRLWWKVGWAMLIPSAAVQLPFMRSGDDFVYCTYGKGIKAQLLSRRY